jgi:hypothetical protein
MARMKLDIPGVAGMKSIFFDPWLCVFGTCWSGYFLVASFISPKFAINVLSDPSSVPSMLKNDVDLNHRE